MMWRIDCGEDFNGTSTKSGERRLVPVAPELYALRPRRTANRERTTKEKNHRKGEMSEFRHLAFIPLPREDDIVYK